MTDFTFTKATKKAAKGRIAIDGPSGSGKTYTALTIAGVLGDRIAVIDTEHGSASKYADLFTFDTLHLHRYSPQILIDALTAAGGAGYEVVVVDSLSHFWMHRRHARASRQGGQARRRPRHVRLERDAAG